MLPSFYPSIFAKIRRKCKGEGEKSLKKFQQLIACWKLNIN